MTAERLHDLQRAITELYRLPRGEDVRAFVCDASTARKLAGDETVSRGEALLVLEDDAGSFVGLYLDDDAVSLASGPESWLEGQANLGASCLVAEGVSHFVMVQYRAAQEIPVSELELELQAEVDKWALGALGGEATRSTSLLEGLGAGLIRERSRMMRRRLFSNATLIDDPESERGERYQRAIRLAHQYTMHLEHTALARGDTSLLLSELRAFYRMVGQKKLAHAAR